jgi:hypothetical protein
MNTQHSVALARRHALKVAYRAADNAVDVMLNSAELWQTPPSMEVEDRYAQALEARKAAAIALADDVMLGVI